MSETATTTTTTTPATPEFSGTEALATGTLAERGDGVIVLAIPGTDYRLRLTIHEPFESGIGARVRGRIRVTARRMDVIPAGGRYIEPNEGPPRRVQGRIQAIDEVNDELLVHAGAPILVRPDTRQRASDFAVGRMVAFDVLPGAAFEPA